jgi:hypothetical protein
VEELREVIWAFSNPHTGGCGVRLTRDTGSHPQPGRKVRKFKLHTGPDRDLSCLAIHLRSLKVRKKAENLISEASSIISREREMA